MTHYEILQISETASPEIIRAAYMALAKKYHPDLNRDNLAQAEEKMKQINTAYETLSDPSKRRDYDLQLRINHSSQTSRRSSYQHTQYQSNHSQTYSNANTSQHSQYQSNSYQNSQHQSNSKSYTPPKTTNQSPSRIKKQLVKVLIWFLCALGYGLLMATFNVLGGTLGGLPTIALAGGTILLAKASCKKWDEHWSKKHTSSQKESHPPKKEKNKTWLWVLLLTVFVISTIAIPLCIYYYSADTTSYSANNTSPTPKSEPRTGKILEGYERYNASSVTVVAPENESCVVTLKDRYQSTVVSFYVRAGERATIGVPYQTLYAFFMSGTTWYGTKDLFGNNTAYRADSEGKRFDEHTYIYTVFSNKAPISSIVKTFNQTTETPTQSTQSTQSTQNTTSTQPTLPSVSEPTTGTILEGHEQNNASSVTVIAPQSESCVFTLKDSSEKTVVSFYVRAGETATVGVPNQTLYAFFSTGTTWHGKDRLFGEETSYRADSTGRNFEKSTYEYTISSRYSPTSFVTKKIDKTPPETDTPALIPVTEPITGTVLEGHERYNASEITVTASYSEACVVKLKDLWGDTVLSFYVRAGQTATVSVPAQRLYVYFASGKTWYGKEKLFGSSTSYSKDDGSLDFENYAWTYTLYPVTDGNFTETPIDADEFFD